MAEPDNQSRRARARQAVVATTGVYVVYGLLGLVPGLGEYRGVALVAAFYFLPAWLLRHAPEVQARYQVGPDSPVPPWSWRGGRVALVAALVVFLILWVFAQVDRLVDVLGREIRTYDITYIARENKLLQIEAAMAECKLRIIRRRRMKVGENLLQGSWELRGALARHTHFSDIMLADEDIVGLKY